MNQDHPLDHLLDEMLPKAAEVAVAVRDRDADAVSKALKPLLFPLDLYRIEALIIDLAVLVPDDAPFGDLLAWTHGPHVPDELYDQIAAFEIPPDTKPCTRCERVLPLTDYHNSASNPDGHKARCKRCVSEIHLEQKAARDTSRSAVAAAAETDSGVAVAA